MSQIRLYLDEDATHNRLLQALHNRGVDVNGKPGGVLGCMD